jgi:hypothetical protein
LGQQHEAAFGLRVLVTLVDVGKFHMGLRSPAAPLRRASPPGRGPARSIRHRSSAASAGTPPATAENRSASGQRNCPLREIG